MFTTVVEKTAWHATITDVPGVPVEDFMKEVVGNRYKVQPLMTL